MKFILVALLILTVVPVQASDPYDIKPDLSEKELRRLYTDVMYRFTRFAETMWKQSPDDPKAGYWGNGISGGNEGIRAVANTALVYAVLAEETDVLDAATRRAYIERALAGLRYAANSHLTGTGKCIDGKQWGNSWQSTLWGANVGFAAWILRDHIDADLRASVERMVAYEADRFLKVKPRGARYGNTLAEEVGWDQILISLAPNMMPDHPNAPRWREKSSEWMMNALSAPQDLKDTRIVDGRPVKDWITALNTHPDFLVENHGFFHPSYTFVSATEIAEGALFYAYAGRPIPEAADHRQRDNWWAMQEFIQPSGEWIFVQGQDWELHSDSHIHYLAWQATRYQDPLAGVMERQIAQRMRDQQKLYGGRLAGPASSLGYARDAIQMERTSYAYLYHRYIGPAVNDPAAAQRMWRALNGVRRHPHSDFITHRTDSKFASFSWKNKIMGQVIPIGPWYGNNPHFTTPITNGFVGSFAIADPSAKGLKVVERSWKRPANGFETRGTLSVNGGFLKQELVFASVGERMVVYLDRVTAQRDVRIEQEIGVPFGVENDELNGDRRMLYHQGGSQLITGPDTDQTIRIPGRWANVDGRLGVIAASGSGLAYRDVPKYNRNGAREDFLYGSFSSEPRDYKAGDLVAQRAVVFLTETSPEETAALADKVRIEKRADGTRLSVELPEGGYSFDL